MYNSNGYYTIGSPLGFQKYEEPEEMAWAEATAVGCGASVNEAGRLSDALRYAADKYRLDFEDEPRTDCQECGFRAGDHRVARAALRLAKFRTIMQLAPGRPTPMTGRPSTGLWKT